MENYKLKTVVFYVFATTIMSFDLKGSENENEGNCPCCNCCNKEEKPEVGKNIEEKKEEENANNKEKEKKEENKEENKEGEGDEGGDDGGYEGGDEGEEEEGEDEGEGGGEGGGEDEDEEKNFISKLEQCFNKVIKEEKHKKYFGNNKKEKKRLFIVDLNNVLNEIIFEDLEDTLSEIFFCKESVTNDNLDLDNFSLVSYCPKDENNEEFEICEFKMDHDSTIKDVFDYFKNASTWVNEDCLILFIKDQYSNIARLVPYTDFFYDL